MSAVALLFAAPLLGCTPAVPATGAADTSTTGGYADDADTTDEDGDGFDGQAHGGDDCDDTNPAVHPGAADDMCDGVDDDCDGTADQGAVFEIPEEEPNDTPIDTTELRLRGDTWTFQTLPRIRDACYTVGISGTMKILSQDPEYQGSDVDVYALQGEKTLNSTLVLSWEDPSVDLDLLVMDAQGAIATAGWAFDNVNPETVVLGQVDLAVSVSSPLYLVVVPWAGAEGDHGYTLDLTFAMPSEDGRDTAE